MEVKTAKDLIGFLLETKEGEMGEYLRANEGNFREALKVAAECMEKQLKFQRVINNTVCELFMLAHEE